MLKKEKNKINKVKRETIDEIMKELSLKEISIPKEWLEDKKKYRKVIDRLIGHNWAIKDMFAILIRLKKKI